MPTNPLDVPWWIVEAKQKEDTMASSRKRHYGNPLNSDVARCGIRITSVSVFETLDLLTDDIDDVTCVTCLRLMGR